MTVFNKFGFEICNFKHWSCDILERYCTLRESNLGDSDGSVEDLLSYKLQNFPVTVVHKHHSAFSRETLRENRLSMNNIRLRLNVHVPGFNANCCFDLK